MNVVWNRSIKPSDQTAGQPFRVGKHKMPEAAVELNEAPQRYQSKVAVPAEGTGCRFYSSGGSTRVTPRFIAPIPGPSTSGIPLRDII
jgi:hypothetical protein